MKRIDKNQEIKVFHGFLEQTHEDVRLAAGMASDLLIDGFGQCNWDNIDLLYEEAAYQVRAGEQDRFGWQTGHIHLERGILVYG